MNYEELIGDFKAHCLAKVVRKLNREVTKIYDQQFLEFDIKASQVNILAMVANNNLCTPSTISKALSIERSTVSRNISKMEKNYWLKLHLSNGHRVSKVEITKKGKEKLEQVYPKWKSAQTLTKKLLSENIVLIENAIKKAK